MPITSTRGNYFLRIGLVTIVLEDAFCKFDNLPYEIKLYVTGLRSLQFVFYNLALPHCIFTIIEQNQNRGKIAGLISSSFSIKV